MIDRGCRDSGGKTKKQFPIYYPFCFLRAPIARPRLVIAKFWRSGLECIGYSSCTLAREAVAYNQTSWFTPWYVTFWAVSRPEFWIIWVRVLEIIWPGPRRSVEFLNHHLGPVPSFLPLGLDSPHSTHGCNYLLPALSGKLGRALGSFCDKEGIRWWGTRVPIHRWGVLPSLCWCLPKGWWCWWGRAAVGYLWVTASDVTSILRGFCPGRDGHAHRLNFRSGGAFDFGWVRSMSSSCMK